MSRPETLKGEDLLLAIAEKACTPEERLGGPYESTVPAPHERIVQTRLITWRNNAAKGDEREFTGRLALAGWTTDDALRALGPVRLAKGAPLPAWTATLDRLLQSIETCRLPAAEEKPDFLDAGDPVLHEELLVPLVRTAWEVLAEAESERLPWMGEKAQRDLKRHLLKRLSHLSRQTLDLEYAAYRAPDLGGIARLFANRLQTSAGGRADRSGYLRFVERMFQGKWLALLNEYPVLARLLAQEIDRWREAAGEFLQRYVRDREAIGAAILGGEIPGRIASLRPGLSDPHNGGRTVIIAELDDGRKIVYKPKSLHISAAWNRLLGWLNERAECSPDLKGLKVLDRGAYGWEEYAAHAPCGDAGAVRRYYRRTGAILCLAYALDGSDFHHENLIACGEYPVLVDLETLLHPRPDVPFEEEYERDALAPLGERMNRSVLGTLLLPAWNRSPEGSCDIGGLFVSEEPGRVETGRIRGIRSGGMFVREQETTASKRNAPVLDGRNVSVEAYLSDFLDGFRDMYETLLRHRDELADPSGPLSGFRGAPVRLVFRATAVYGRLLRQSLHPKYLRDGADFALQFETLYRAVLGPAGRKKLWPLVRKEIRDMLGMDIPFFTIRSDEKGVRLGEGGRSEDLCKASGFDRALEKIRSLSPEDCAFQLRLIRGSMDARTAGTAHAAVGAPKPDGETAPEQMDTGTTDMADAALEAARAIAERLRAQMIETDDGFRVWLAPRLVHDRHQFSLTGYDLYSGLAGIALFFAALSAVSGDPEYRRDALAVLRAPRRDLRRNGPRLMDRMGLGGIGGLPSILYAFLLIHRLVGAPELLEDALEIAEFITEEAIGKDRRFDVLHVAAGGIFALLALHDATRSESALRRAAACGAHLMRHRVAAENGRRVWKSEISARPLCGFSHGASGIAAALLRLHARTGDPALMEAALEALAFERACFRPETGLWPDLRYGHTAEGLTDAWCHGAAGIGLARLEALRCFPASEPETEPVRTLRHELETAVSIVRRAPRRNVSDAVCCGRMGRLDFLLAACEPFSGSGTVSPAFADLPDIVRKHAAETIAFFRKHGYFRYSRNPEFQPPGFFLGISGTGYQLLRVFHPGRLPSVLRFEI